MMVLMHMIDTNTFCHTDSQLCDDWSSCATFQACISISLHFQQSAKFEVFQNPVHIFFNRLLRHQLFMCTFAKE